MIQIISGCQTGVDQAALQAAFECNIVTGGYVRVDHMTKTGPRPDLTDKYHLWASCADYRERTWKNVRLADATIRIAHNFNSPGEVCTKNAIIKYAKPSLDIAFFPPMTFGVFPHEVVQWLNDNNVKTLNVAGNSEGTIKIQERARIYLVEVFELWKGLE